MPFGFGKKKKEEPQPQYGAIYRFEGISSQKQLQLTATNKKLRVLLSAYKAKELTHDQFKEETYNTIVLYVPREDILSDNQTIGQYLSDVSGLSSSDSMSLLASIMLAKNRIRGI